MATIDKIRLSGTTYDLIDSTAIHSLQGYATTGDVTAATEAVIQTVAEAGYQTSGDVQNAITAVTNPINSVLTAHTANTEIHVTVSDKNAWNAKLDSSDVENFFGAVNYDSTAKRINFYNTSTGGTVLGYVDTTDFVKDGMVSNVEITGGNLVITFNTDSGKEAISIPISQIFDASNYYTKSEVDSAISGFAESTAVTQEISEAVSGKVDTSTYETYTGTTVPSLLGDKQDTLVNQTNIKSINGQSLLGSGNITINEGGTIDSELSSTSTNAVQNKVVKAAIDAKNQVVTLDGTTLVIS